MITDYPPFDQSLENAQIDFSPSFCHGLLTAYATKHEEKSAWPALLINDFEPNNNDHQNAVSSLNPHLDDIQQQLSDEGFSFQLLLDEDADIREHVLSLREWASGYWLGLQNIVLPPQAIDEQSVEFIKDLPHIVNLALPEEADPDTLADLMELQEYCRIGAIGLFLNSWQTTQAKPNV